MNFIKGVYRIPAVKNVFYVFDPSFLIESSTLSHKNKETREYFANILLQRDRKDKKRCLKWTIKLIPESDFLLTIGQQISIYTTPSNPSFDIPECMELLTINLVKTPESSFDSSFHTPKVLSGVPSEDIIEVFI